MLMELARAHTTEATMPERHWHRVFVAFFSELQVGDEYYLLSAARHAKLLTVRRAAAIISRVRLLALMFAILTPAWSVIDYFVFPVDIWMPLTLLRVSAGAAFLAIFLCYSHKEKRLSKAYQALIFLFLIPAIFYPVSQYFLMSAVLIVYSAYLVSVAYAFLPYILMACLAFFPLSLKESLVLSFLVLAAQLTGILMPQNNHFINDYNTLWLLVLLGCIATMSGISQLALMIALVRQAVRDALTGCFIRSSGRELLAMQFSIAMRGKTSLSLAFIDLDHFKSVNDRFGHEAGDSILRHATVAIINALRDSDLLIRWGGEEFLVVMPNTSLEQAKTAMERLCYSGLCKQPDGTVMTASIGLSEVWRDAVSNMDHLIDLADQRMYLAKQSGRNAISYTGGSIAHIKAYVSDDQSEPAY